MLADIIFMGLVVILCFFRILSWAQEMFDRDAKELKKLREEAWENFRRR